MAFNPWLIATLVSAIPGLFSRGSSGYDELQKILNRYVSPEVLAGDTNRLFDLFRTSPAYTAALQAGLGGARVSSGAAERSLAAAGLGESGVGAIARAVGAGSANRAISGVNTAAFNNAFLGANQLLNARVAGLGLPQPRNIPLDTIGALIASLGSAYRPAGSQTNAAAAANVGAPANVASGNNIFDIFDVLRGRS